MNENNYYVEIRILNKDKEEIYKVLRSEKHIKRFKEIYKKNAIEEEIREVLRKNKL